MIANPVEQFRAALVGRNIIPPANIIGDGRIHRCDAEGKNGKGDAAYLLHLDGVPAGGFENHRDGEGWEAWKADIGRKLTFAEIEAQRLTIEAAKREREADAAKRRAEARDRARGIWEASQPATAEHPYLARKRAKTCGARLHDGCIVVPVRDSAGELHSLQFIAADGSKRFLPGGRVSGCYHAIGAPNGSLCVAEGFATAASIYQAGHAVAVAFDAGNLEPVARALRAKYPDLPIIVCADDDAGTPGNPGITKANAAALSIGGRVAIPDFGGARPAEATDHNDLANHLGLDAVKRSIAAARAPEPVEPPAKDAIAAQVSQGQPRRQNAAAAFLTGDDWPELKPLPVGLPAVAEFDFALFPESLRPWASDICERVQCPPDYVGATIMAALGSVIGRKVGIRPQAQTDWTEYANQWAMIIGRPGVMKSPAMDAALAPLKRLAAEASKTYEGEATAYEHRARLAKIRADAGERAARQKAEKDRSADLSDLLCTEPIPDAPTLRRYIANDTSGASLGELLRQNPNGTLVFRDELVSLLKGLDREDNASERGFYLTGWTGKSAYTFDRIGRGMNLFIPAVCISLLGSTQPGRIAEYVNAAVRGGSGDDGLLQRFGLTIWPDTAGDWRDVDRWPDSEARRAAHRVFDELDQLSPTDRGAQQDDDAEPPYLRLDDSGRELFLGWRTNLETRLRANELHPAMEAHLAKYRKLVPSLALILHLADGGNGPVTERATLKALAWAEYLETHAGRLYASAASPEVAAAKAILAKLRQHQLLGRFAARDVYRKGWANLSDRRQVEEGLQLLVDFDWLAVTTLDTAGRWATVYEANPKGLQP